ncbi:distal tail protein Dit [Heyndrickxia coagulans]|uniref:distal tail protein Dit n=1 Tax=Heyndrickxia coagulans TaxID=1398 RepID=UPI003D1F22EB
MIGITFNGVHSSTFGLIYESSERPIMPELKDTYVDVPHRDGAILVPDKSAKDITITVKFTLQKNSVQELFDTARQIGAWLTTAARAPLIFDDDPNYYYNAKASASITLEQLADFDRIAEFTVQFRCEPYPYKVGG